MDAIVLCGGKGSRLASVVSNVPKPMALVNGRPFVEYVLEKLVACGIVERAILASGHLAGHIKDVYPDKYKNMQLVHSCETEPLGTAGAILLAMKYLSVSKPFFVLNGDSYIDVDFVALLDTLIKMRVSGALAIHRVPDVARFGTVNCKGNAVTSFSEKSGVNASGTINAGVYAFTYEALSKYIDVEGYLSLEQTVLPELAESGCLAALESGTKFVDIGLPETYAGAQTFSF